MGNEFEQNREAAARARRDEELGLPNFAALREWIDKLEEWCRVEAEDLAKDEARIEQMDETLARAEERVAEGENATAMMESMWEGLADVERGVRTFEEFMEKHRREAFY